MWRCEFIHVWGVGGFCEEGVCTSLPSVAATLQSDFEDLVPSTMDLILWLKVIRGWTCKHPDGVAYKLKTDAVNCMSAVTAVVWDPDLWTGQTLYWLLVSLQDRHRIIEGLTVVRCTVVGCLLRSCQYGVVSVWSSKWLWSSYCDCPCCWLQGMCTCTAV